MKLTLEMLGKEYKSEGKTMTDALLNLGIDYTQIKGKGVITITKGKAKAEKLFYMRPLRMLFASKMRRTGFIRQLESLLEAKVAGMK